MHKQLKKISIWLTRKRALLFVLILSMALLGYVSYHFAAENNWLEDEFASQGQSMELNNELARLSIFIKITESANRGYAISGDRKFIENFDATI
ncbi:MAG: hypothetical protein EPN92_04100, partial [Chitinophagaceae bacterium]